MKTFKAHGNASLKAHEVELMADIYEDVKLLAPGSMPISLNKACPGCIRDAFHVFCSVFDRLAKDPHVNPDADPLKNEVKRDEQLHLSPESEAALLGYLGITSEAAPFEYLIRLKHFISIQDPAINISDLTEKRDQLTAQVNSLPLVPPNEVIAVYNDVYELGLTEEQINAMSIAELAKILDERELSVALDQPDPAKDLPEHLKETVQVHGTALNTPETMTGAQKLAAAKAKKNAK